MNTTKHSHLYDALVVAAIPIVGYWVAYFYELGYCKYFSIPSSFIEIGIINVLNAIVGVVGIATLLYPATEFFTLANIHRLPSVLKWRFMKVGFIAFITISLGILNRLLFRDFIWIIGLIIVITFIEFVLPLLTQPRVNGYIAKLEAHRKLDFTYDSAMDIAVKKIGIDVFTATFKICVATFILYLAGAYVASTQREFIIIHSTHNQIVLKTYGSSFLIADFEKEHKRILPGFRLIEKNAIVGVLCLESVGPVTR